MESTVSREVMETMSGREVGRPFSAIRVRALIALLQQFDGDTLAALDSLGEILVFRETPAPPPIRMTHGKYRLVLGSEEGVLEPRWRLLGNIYPNIGEIEPFVDDWARTGEETDE